MKAFLAVIRRDLWLAYYHRSQVAQPLVFFLMIISLFPLAIDFQANTLKIMAPGIIWLAVLLSILLSLEHLFKSDFEDGSLTELLLSPHAAMLLVSGKIVAHWLIACLPLIVCVPLAALFLSMPVSGLPILMLSLLLGTPVLSGLGAIGVALTLSVKRSGLLLSLLVLPLCLPVLILGTSVTQTALQGLPVTGQLLLLAALLTFNISCIPAVVTLALQINHEF